MLINNEWVNNEIKEEIRRYLETNETKNTMTQKSIGHRKNSPKRKIHSNISLSQETNKNLK